MMENQNIVCFAKDWTEDPTSNNHVMRLLAKNNKVLWINSISTRTPSLGSRSDITKMGRKAAQFAKNATRGAEEVDENLYVFTPLVLPLPHSPIAQAANKQILRGTIAALRRQLKMEKFQLWSFLPTAVNYAGAMGEDLVVYYITDEFSQFSNIDTEKVIDMEKRLCQSADVVFCTANSLLEAKGKYNPSTFLASHGVDHAHFSQALSPDAEVADELKGIEGPVVGFFGLIHDWIDIAMLAKMARLHPEWTLAIVGEWKIDVSELQALPNVKMLGRKTYESLPAYCKAFSVATIPFIINDLTKHVNPIKLREYLSAGLPVVSTPLPEVVCYEKHCEIASTPDEFIAATERAIKNDSPAKRAARSKLMKAETWERKVEKLGDHVMEAARRKGC